MKWSTCKKLKGKSRHARTGTGNQKKLLKRKEYLKKDSQKTGRTQSTTFIIIRISIIIKIIVVDRSNVCVTRHNQNNNK